MHKGNVTCATAVLVNTFAIWVYVELPLCRFLSLLRCTAFTDWMLDRQCFAVIAFVMQNVAK